MPAARTSRRPSAACAARHQSSGSCSDQPGCGVESGYSCSARATTPPLAETAIAFTPVVPTSIPTAIGSAAMELRELVPGLWRWTARHPEWEPGAEPESPADWPPDVGCVACLAGENLALIDPLVPD